MTTYKIANSITISSFRGIMESDIGLYFIQISFLGWRNISTCNSSFLTIQCIVDSEKMKSIKSNSRFTWIIPFLVKDICSTIVHHHN